MIRRLLVCEFLHADPAAFAIASPSLKDEGRLMLAALLADAVRVSDLDVRVVLCPAAAARLPVSESCTVVQSTDGRPLYESLAEATQDRDAVLLIAPESDGCLLRLCRDLRTAGRRVLLPSTDTVRVCGDKLACFNVLAAAGLPVVETFDPDDDSVNVLPESFVVKPRFGCGCENVRRAGHEEIARMPHTGSGSLARFVVQPFREGDWLSIGLIGQGEGHEPLILPLADQHISWRKTGPVYSGGRIPAVVPPAVHDMARSLARGVHNVLPVTDGYVGIDLLFDRDADMLSIMEVNPRPCTSYVGYRRLTADNLMRHILCCADRDAIQWRSAPVEFSVEPPARDV